MKILLIWIKNSLPEEYHYTLLTLKRFLREDDQVDIIVDDITKNIEDFKDFNKLHINEFLNEKELNFINNYKFIENYSDILRFKWLAQNEGLYLDIDTIHFKDFHDLIDINKGMVLFEELTINKTPKFLCGFIYSKKLKFFKIILNYILNYKQNPNNYLLNINILNFLINKNKSKLNLLVHSEIKYVFYNYFEQINMWNNENLEFVIKQLLLIYKNPNIYGLVLMKDPINGKYNREQYVINFIKNYILIN